MMGLRCVAANDNDNHDYDNNDDDNDDDNGDCNMLMMWETHIVEWRLLVCKEK